VLIFCPKTFGLKIGVFFKINIKEYSFCNRKPFSNIFGNKKVISFLIVYIGGGGIIQGEYKLKYL
jgi:hypothetical protein